MPDYDLEGHLLYTGDPRYQHRPKPPSIVGVVEPRAGYWSRNSEFGQGHSFASSDDNRQTIFKLSECGMPRVWTINLGLYFDPSLVPNTLNFQVTADIIWGSGGVSHRALVDWNQGTQVRVAANAIEVSAVYNRASAESAGAFVVPDDLQLLANVGQGFGAVVAPTLTDADDTIATGTSAVYQIPAFASSLVINGRNAASEAAAISANVIYRFLQAPVPLATAVDVAYIIGTDLGSARYSQGVPVPNGARYLQITNNSGGFIFLTKVWRLAL